MGNPPAGHLPVEQGAFKSRPDRFAQSMKPDPGTKSRRCPPCLGTGFDRGQERRGICESCGGTGRGWWSPSRWLTDEKLESLV